MEPQEMEFSTIKITNFLIFFQKGFSYISEKWKSYISGNGTFNPKIGKIKRSTTEDFLIFQEMQIFCTLFVC